MMFNRLKNWVKTNPVLVCIGLLVTAVLIGHYVAGSEPTRFLMTSLVFGVALTNSVSWYRAASEAWRNRIREGADNIVLSIWLTWTTMLIWFAWIIYFVQMGRPEYLRELPITTLVYTALFVNGTMAVLAPVNTDSITKKPTLIIIASILGGLVGGIILTLLWLRIIQIPT